MVDIKYWAALNLVPRLGPVRFRRLEAYFEDMEKAWKASLSEFKAAGLDDRTARDLISLRGKITPESELERILRAGINLACWHDDDYPVRLKEIADPPPVLYFKGTLLPSDERSLAVVGTRGPTSYWKGSNGGAYRRISAQRYRHRQRPGERYRRSGSSSGSGERWPDHRRSGQWSGHNLSQGTHQLGPTDRGLWRYRQRISSGRPARLQEFSPAKPFNQWHQPGFSGG